jgi:hypothetical protein
MQRFNDKGEMDDNGDFVRYAALLPWIRDAERAKARFAHAWDRQVVCAFIIGGAWLVGTVLTLTLMAIQ